ncbi:restriction endonuclease subunit S [Zhenpiania hominis]|uniref:Restriction endonuclease subunit S n=1 Tax=Zhenpiania hominis TaxID=2763644 RepID=A0A923NLZ9_9FIRM|nr:restriction endonuclease subunit S [Zhenpiania hominis]
MKCIEDEIPFEMPEGWEWCRVRDIASVKGGKRLPKGMSFSLYKTSHAYIRVTDMKNHAINTDDLKYISEDVFLKIKNYTISKDDLYVTIAGTIGVAGEVPAELDGMNLTENAAKVTNIQINKSFLCLLLQSEFVQQQFKGKTHQVAMPKLALERILSTLIPVCSTETQAAIVKRFCKIDQLIDLISKEKDALTDTVSKTKSKILDLAIRGQLVPQDPNDEPASVLLKRIKAKKEELIKQRKIKRDKRESIIFKGEDNSYYEIICNKVNNLDDSNLFDLPDNWCWCRMRSIADVKGGKRLPKGCNFSDTSTNHAYIRVTDMKNRTINTTDLRYISDEVYEQIKSYIISKNDLYITIAGTIGLVGEIPDELDNMNLTENAAKICNIKINKKYLLYILSSQFVQNQFQEKTHQVAMPKLALERILTTIIPIPPFKEQLLIVKKIEEILCRMDAIENCTY